MSEVMNVLGDECQGDECRTIKKNMLLMFVKVKLGVKKIVLVNA